MTEEKLEQARLLKRRIDRCKELIKKMEDSTAPETGFDTRTKMVNSRSTRRSDIRDILGDELHDQWEECSANFLLMSLKHTLVRLEKEFESL